MNNVQVIITDPDFQRIIAANGKRIKGSIAMISPNVFEFKAFAPSHSHTPKPVRELHMKHGKATVAPDRMRLYVMVKTKNVDYPIDIICKEANEAVEFFNN